LLEVRGEVIIHIPLGVGEPLARLTIPALMEPMGQNEPELVAVEEVGNLVELGEPVLRVETLVVVEVEEVVGPLLGVLVAQAQ
jgi:hypothetical protein